MNKNIVTTIGGVLILMGALVLAFYTAGNATKKSLSDAKIINKYVLLSNKALEKGNSKEAEKIIQKALEVDSKSKVVIAQYKKIILSTIDVNTVTQNSNNTIKKDTAPVVETEDEMGCI